MTREGLHAKSDIASELAFRDKQIAERDETIRRLRAEAAKWERLHDELERERDEAAEERELFRKSIIEQQMTIDDLGNRLNVISGVRNELRAKLAEYEQAPMVAIVAADYFDEGAWNYVSQECAEWDLPPVGTVLIARPTRKGQATQTCPECGALEIAANTPRTTYACGSSDYDQRPGTFINKCRVTTK